VSSRLSWIWRPLGIYAASRLAVGVAVAVAADLVPLPGIPSLRTWDHGWYLGVAQGGYPDFVPEVAGRAVQNNLGFFPLFPLLLRAVHGLGLSWEMTALVTSAATGLAATLLVWRLLEALSGRRAADRGVALFCFFPGAFVLSFAYAEGLMLALAAACLLALRRHRWLTAGVLAALASATRPNGIALAGACAWAALVAVRSRREWRALAAPLLAPAGLLAFFAYLRLHTGQIDAYLRSQREGWGQKLDPTSGWDNVTAFARHPFADTNITVMVAGTAFLVLTIVVLARTRPPGILVAYTAGVIALALLTPTMGPRPRFLLTAFPLVTSLGEGLPATAFPAVLGSFATLLGCLTVLTLSALLATP
jgi:glycosyl transferase family 87